MADRLVIEFQEAPLQDVHATVNLRGPTREGSPEVGEIDTPPTELKQAFADEIPLIEQTIRKPQFFVKLYSTGQQEVCNDEVAAWRTVRESEYFAAVPAVLRKAQLAKVVQGASGRRYCIVMEKAGGLGLDEWFERVAENSPSLPIVLHQFFSLWLQLFDILKFLHLNAHLYHADIKPDNIRFFNNSLHLIDFNAVTGQIWTLPYGTARYAPNCVLESTRPNGGPSNSASIHCGYFDLYCAGIMLLEVLARICLKPKFHLDDQGPFSHLCGYFSRKKDAQGPEKWTALKTENLHIYDVVQKWAGKSRLGRYFRDLLDERRLNEGTPEIKEAYDEILSHSVREYIGWALADIRFQKRRGSLLKGPCTGDFQKTMSQLVTNYSRSLFAHTYPLLYLDYSDGTGVYDRQAEAATRRARKCIGSLKGKTCLDVGCGFGTAARHAAEAGCDKILCLDNSPYFERLAAILWGHVAVNKWEQCFPSATGLIKAAHGNNGKVRMKRLLAKYRRKFTAVRAEEWDYDVVDYWWLGAEMPKERFDYIICNNFLHWPIIDFQRMNADCSGFYCGDVELGRSGLHELLHPLLSHLKPSGCLVIVEPSLFFTDDTDPEGDREFFANRFTEQGVYIEAQKHARQVLASDVFGEEWEMPLRRDCKFWALQFQTLTDQGYRVTIEKKNMRFEGGVPTREVWINTIIGEFNMTLKNLEAHALQRLSERDKLAAFYGKFREYLEAQQMPAALPVEPTYIITIQSSAD
jgi:serine/threonine protein kinase